MSKTINIAAYGAPTMWVNIDDLSIPVGVPDVTTVGVMLDKLTLIAKAKEGITEETYDLAFEMLAVMLSSNHNYRKFTPEELKAKRITVSQIIGVLTDWLGFIGEVANQKN